MKTVSNNSILSSSNLKSSQLGFSLIESLIAAFLLSFAILGIAGLQVIGMKGTHQSLMKQQAVGVVQNITERMRSNNTALASYEFDSANINCGSAAIDCSSRSCTVAEIAALDINNIVCGYGGNPNTAALKSSAAGTGTLVNGSLKVECIPATNCATGDVRITVGWTERELGQETVVTPDSLILTTRIVQ